MSRRFNSFTAKRNKSQGYSEGSRISSLIQRIQWALLGREDVSLLYFSLEHEIPFLALFSMAILAVHFYARHRSGKNIETPGIGLRTVSMLTYGAVIGAATGGGLWAIAGLLFAKGAIAESDIFGRLTFFLRPDIVAIDQFIRYLLFFLVPFALLLQRKRRGLLSSIFAAPTTPATRTLLLCLLCGGAILFGGIIVVAPAYLASGWVPRPERDPILGFSGSLRELTSRLVDVSPAIAVLYAVALVSLVATSEELLFRGIIYSGLREKIGVAGALVLESAMFSTSHERWFGSPLMVHFFVAGVCLTWLYERTRSLYPSVAVHGLLLTLSILLGFAFRK